MKINFKKNQNNYCDRKTSTTIIIKVIKVYQVNKSIYNTIILTKHLRYSQKLINDLTQDKSRNLQIYETYSFKDLLNMIKVRHDILKHIFISIT